MRRIAATAWSTRIAPIVLAAAVSTGLTAGCSTAAPSASGALVPAGASSPAGPAIASSSASGAPRPAPVPVLGRATDPGEGLGTERPRVIDRGGDSNGVIEGITWTRWGGPTAEGTGTADWVAPGAPLASGSPERAVVVASNLGDCGGRPAYRSLGVYFPQHGESGPDGVADVCDG